MTWFYNTREKIEVHARAAHAPHPPVFLENTARKCCITPLRRRTHSAKTQPPLHTMKSFAAVAATSLCALAPAAAFVPGVPLAGVRSAAAAPSKLSMAATPERSVSIPIDPYPEGLDGEMVGDVGFDPAGFANNPPSWVQGPGTGTAGRVRWYREAELAHCRVAMLAATGWIFPELYHFPGNTVLGPDRFAEMNPLLAYGNIPNAGGIQIVATILILETIRLNRSIRNPDGVPGDIGLGQGEGRWNPFNFNYTDEEYKEKQLQVSAPALPLFRFFMKHHVL